MDPRRTGSEKRSLGFLFLGVHFLETVIKLEVWNWVWNRVWNWVWNWYGTGLELGAGFDPHHHNHHHHTQATHTHTHYQSPQHGPAAILRRSGSSHHMRRPKATGHTKTRRPQASPGGQNQRSQKGPWLRNKKASCEGAGPRVSHEVTQ